MSDVNVVELDRTFFQTFLPAPLLPAPSAPSLAVSVRYVPTILGTFTEVPHNMIPNGFKIDITNVRARLFFTRLLLLSNDP